MSRPRPGAQASLLAIAGGVEPAFAAKLRLACESLRERVLLGQAETPGQLIDIVQQAGPQGRVLAVIAGRWLREDGLDLLIRMRRFTPNPSTLAVAAELGPLGLGHALRLGLRGLVQPGDSIAQLSRAISAVAAGELWLSRRVLLDAMLMLSPTESDAATASDTWVKLPTLTCRERDVLMQVLDGQPNKLIARRLGMSEQTVKIHLVHVYRKLGVRRRVDLLKAFADSRGSQSPPVLSLELQSA